MEQQNQKEIIKGRLSAVRDYMNKHGLSAVIVPSTDPHSGEYVPEHWKVREWLTGFTGSAGTAVVTKNEAALWTDSRYFIQAEEQLADTGICLMKERLPETPLQTDWLGSVLQSGDTVGMVGTTQTLSAFRDYESALAVYDIRVVALYPEPWDLLWEGRPSLPDNPVVIQPLEYAGKNCREKLADLRSVLQANRVEGIVLSTLDEIAWLLNVRGTDVHCNPVAVSYLVVTSEKACFFCATEKLSAEVQAYLSAEGVDCLPYSSFFDWLSGCSLQSVQVHPASSNYEMVHRLPATCQVVEKDSPVALMKAVKSAAEIEGFRQAMVRDGVAMVRFLRWLEQELPSGEVTELSVDRALWRFRSEQPLFRDISFDTIAGYKEHGAIVHYEATPETDAVLRPEGFLLLDSGAQYQDATTDITRTIPLGPLTEEERRDYTLVLKGHIALARAVFPQGTCGTQLDVLARQAMWREGINYLHGTGHGVGSYLNVHEGPHQVRMNHMPTLLVPGMTLTNEPGIYKAGRHGVRTENVMLVVPCMETEFGAFYCFEALTLCPIATSPIVVEMMNAEETEWLNAYHRRVYEALSSHLNETEREWLQKATQAV